MTSDSIPALLPNVGITPLEQPNPAPFTSCFSQAHFNFQALLPTDTFFPDLFAYTILITYLWLISLHIMSPGFIGVFANGRALFFLLLLNNTALCVHTALSLFIHLLVATVADSVSWLLGMLISFPYFLWIYTQ